MERSAKEAKKENKYATTVDGALHRLRAGRDASVVLRDIRSEGFNERRIAELVLMYCGGDPKVAEQGFRQVKSYSTQLKTCGEKLNELAGSVEAMIDLCKRHRRYFQDDELPERMRRFAQVILEEADIHARGLRKIRLGSSDQGGRDWVLAYLVYFLSGGEKPSVELYRRIAKMVAAVVGDKNPDYVTMADRLRKAVERFLISAETGGLVIESARVEFEKRQSTSRPASAPRT